MPRQSPDDRGLWRRAMAGVAPLRRPSVEKRPHPIPTPLAGEGSGHSERAGADFIRRPGSSALLVGREHQPPPDDFSGVDRRTAERLRRGQMPVEARLDLHGLTQAEAHRALCGFIAGARLAGKRCVLIITGHGRMSGGVLKAATPRWLAEPGLRAHVLTIAPARPQHGGAGALYVLLRRLGR
jgi:DNA-nicking Smr family endonuclease